MKPSKSFHGNDVLRTALRNEIIVVVAWVATAAARPGGWAHSKWNSDAVDEIESASKQASFASRTLRPALRCV